MFQEIGIKETSPNLSVPIVFWRFLNFVFAIFLSFSCKPSSDIHSSIVSLLSLLAKGSGFNNPLAVGQSFDLNGGVSPQVLGTVVDPSNAGIAVGISLRGAGGIPVLVFLYNAGGSPFAVDVNGDGNPDYFLCNTTGTITLKTGISCSGNQVLVIPGSGYDTNGDGVADNTILASIASDTTVPTSTIFPAAGAYGGPQSLTVMCADNIAPGNIIYTTDGSIPSFAPLVGNVTDPPNTNFTVGGAGDGSYTVRYFCRDLAGNSGVVQLAVYQINHNIPNISITTPLSSPYISVNAGAVNSASYSWQSSQSGSYTVRQNATGCSDGTIIESGTVTANSTNTSSILASQLTAGLNSIYICVTAGLTGQFMFNISRDDVSPSVSPTPGGGTFGTAPQNIALGCVDSSSCTVVYTTDGTVPAINALTGAVTNGTVYTSAPVSLGGGATTLKYIGRDGAGNLSSVNSASYTINTTVATITINAYVPASRSINASVSSPVEIDWQSNSPGFYKIFVGSTSTCTSGVQATGTNIGGTVAANSQIASVLDNSNFANGQNTILICVANASLSPQYGSLSTTITKDNIPPTLSSSIPSNLGLSISSSPARITMVFSESMDPSKIGLTSSNDCSTSNSTTLVETDIFDGAGYNCTDVTVTFTWLDVNYTKLQADFSWVNFPENTNIQWIVPSGLLQDVAGNPIASNLKLSFTTGLNPNNKFVVLQTGQSACWDASGNPIPCSGTGQDGQYLSKTARSYSGPTKVNTGDYITKDLVTGLVWKTCALGYEVKTGTPNTCVQNTTKIDPWPIYNNNGQTPALFSAVNACAKYLPPNYGGISTWRLPTQSELATLPKYGSSALPAIDTSAFYDAASGQGGSYWVNFWTATSYFPNPYYSWITSLADGSQSNYIKPNQNEIMCVSSAGSSASQPSYTNNGNGTITDNVTGLVWEQCTEGLSGSNCSAGTATQYTWQAALNRCNALSLATKTWRLPNVNELRSIADYSKKNPAVNSTYFPGTLSAYYWSSTSYTQSPSNAWYVYMSDGLVNPFASKSSTYYVRCVSN